MSIGGRLRKELSLWRMTWQQVETLLDRLEGIRLDDAPDAWTAAVCYEGLDQVEALRARRLGYRLKRRLPFGTPPSIPDVDDAPDPPPPWSPGTPLPTSLEASDFDLPGALDGELAAGSLVVDEENGEICDPPSVRLLASEHVLTVYSDAARDFVPVYAPHYDFGRFEPPRPNAHPLFPALRPLGRTTVEIGEDLSTDDVEEKDVGFFSYPRRHMAGEEGFAPMRTWTDEHERRRSALADDPDAWEDTRGGTPFIEDIVQALTGGDLATARAGIVTWHGEALAGQTHLTSVAARAEHEELDDAVLEALEGLAERLGAEATLLAGLRDSIDAGQDPNLIALGMAFLPSPGGWRVRPHVQALGEAIDSAFAARLTVPDGSQRQIRALEEGLLRFWRARKHWFPQREHHVWKPVVRRFLLPFSQSLSALIAGGATVPSGWEDEQIARAAAAGTDTLVITEAPDARRLRRQRPGRLIRIGGDRPAAAIVLHGKRLDPGRIELAILPLRVSIATMRGLPGTPGLVQAEEPVVRTGRSLDGASIVRGRFEDAPQAEGLLHTAVALWSQLALLQGTPSTPALPSPFDATLRLPVQATQASPLGAGAPLVVLPSAFSDGAADSQGAKLGSPGERLLLTGRTASGDFIRGVVEVAQAVLTTLQALEIDPETDPASPLCCSSETPVLALHLVRNTIPEALVGDVWISRDFMGFGSSLAVGTQLPTEIDGSPQLQVVPSGSQVQFVARPPGAPLATGSATVWVDRGPELAEASRTLERWAPPR